MGILQTILPVPIGTNEGDLGEGDTARITTRKKRDIRRARSELSDIKGAIP